MTVHRLTEKDSLSITSSIEIPNFTSAVKVLLRNAIECGADKIDIKYNTEVRSIIISDNGSGIPSDIFTSIGEHCVTSKIDRYGGLIEGTKGRSLLSLGVVSNMEVLTRLPGEFVSWKKVVAYGCVVESGVTYQGRYCGTTVSVDGLFGRLPVRKRVHCACKESAAVLRFVQMVALLHYDISFTLYNESTGNEICAKDTTLSGRYTQLFGSSSGMSFMDLQDEEVQLKGLISKPNNSSCVIIGPKYIFINNEHEGKRKLYTLFEKSYRRLTGEDPHSYVVMLYCSSKLLLNDNTWIQVKFVDIICNALNITKIDHSPTKINRTSRGKQKPTVPIYPRESHIQISKDHLYSMRFIAQLDNKYLVSESQGTIFALDQHAVDERIQLEKYFTDFMDHIRVIQTDLQIELSEREYRTVLQNNDRLLSFGWTISYQNHNRSFTKGMRRTVLNGIITCEISTIGSLYGREFNMKILKGYIEELASVKRLIPTFIHKIIASKACRSAIMFGDSLSTERCRSLLKELSQCKNPFICAHGRPSIVPLYQQ
eukprot:TRINITY_DN5261_c0_g1_i1.p1 TRINITY_DN5261_c0_g1~~TRINITY_DN5261_c0_g1_i1.p1  ORF type:complete len:541 (-),score=49.26 TRINITY_DN5261_c0_g1_i1:235-1857(-)